MRSFVHLLVLNVDSAITGQLKCAPRPIDQKILLLNPSGFFLRRKLFINDVKIFHKCEKLIGNFQNFKSS